MAKTFRGMRVGHEQNSRDAVLKPYQETASRLITGPRSLPACSSKRCPESQDLLLLYFRK